MAVLTATTVSRHENGRNSSQRQNPFKTRGWRSRGYAGINDGSGSGRNVHSVPALTKESVFSSGPDRICRRITPHIATVLRGSIDSGAWSGVIGNAEYL